MSSKILSGERFVDLTQNVFQHLDLTFPSKLLFLALAGVGTLNVVIRVLAGGIFVIGKRADVIARW